MTPAIVVDKDQSATGDFKRLANDIVEGARSIRSYRRRAHSPDRALSEQPDPPEVVPVATPKPAPPQTVSPVATATAPTEPIMVYQTEPVRGDSEFYDLMQGHQLWSPDDVPTATMPALADLEDELLEVGSVHTEPMPVLQDVVLNPPAVSADECNSTAPTIQYYLQQYLAAIGEDAGAAEHADVAEHEDVAQVVPAAEEPPVQLQSQQEPAPAPETAEAAEVEAALEERQVEQTAQNAVVLRLPGEFVKFGPYDIRPALGHEVPIGRAYQPIPYNSISRLAGYIGLDEYSLYVREIPYAPELGLRPSRNGIWVRQPFELEYRRLKPGDAERITPETEVRIGGDGIDGSTGLRLLVI